MGSTLQDWAVDRPSFAEHSGHFAEGLRLYLWQFSSQATDGKKTRVVSSCNLYSG